MDAYPVLRHLHVACVVVSGCGFALRGISMLLDSPRRHARWVRVAPHVVDTLLLGSAIAMAVLSGQYPFAAAWLTAKLFGLIAYIVLGALALRRLPGRTEGAVAFVAALAVFSWIVSVALTRDPRGWLAALGA